MNIAVILSAGSGSRFKTDMPKQFINLDGAPVITKSLEKFEKAKFIDAIIVVSHPDHVERVEDLAKSYKKVIAVIEGGVRRQDSVFNALKWIRIHSKCSRVWIHDSARPLFSETLLERLYTKSLTEDAVIPVIPSDDTLKKVEASCVTTTIDRTNVCRVQTPQVFNFQTLYKVYSKFSDIIDATDDAFLMEHFGVKISTVEGEVGNIKLTYPVDIKIAELLINTSQKS